jgi:hypothetical protein
MLNEKWKGSNSHNFFKNIINYWPFLLSMQFVLNQAKIEENYFIYFLDGIPW